VDGAPLKAKEEQEEDEFETTLFDEEPDLAALDAERAAELNLTQADLDEPQEILLSETPTHMLFSLRGLCVQKDSDLEKVVKARNDAYIELLAKKSNKDLFTSSLAQTFNPTVKNKRVMAAPPETHDMGCTATGWDIFDATATDDSAVRDFLDLDMDSSKKKLDAQTPLAQQVDEIVRVCLASPGCLLDLSGETQHGRKQCWGSSRWWRAHQPAKRQ
jgi:hypothetical protein